MGVLLTHSPPGPDALAPQERLGLVYPEEAETGLGAALLQTQRPPGDAAAVYAELHMLTRAAGAAVNTAATSDQSSRQPLSVPQTPLAKVQHNELSPFKGLREQRGVTGGMGQAQSWRHGSVRTWRVRPTLGMQRCCCLGAAWSAAVPAAVPGTHLGIRDRKPSSQDLCVLGRWLQGLRPPRLIPARHTVRSCKHRRPQETLSITQKTKQSKKKVKPLITGRFYETGPKGLPPGSG